MRKLIPVLLFTFSGTIAFSQTSSGHSSDSKDNSFAESLRLEIVSGIKKKMATDTTLQKSQELMNDYYKACGLHPVVKKTVQVEPAKAFKIPSEAVSLVVADRN